MDIKLSKRLEKIASLVNDNTNVIDVGCDHALLDIYLFNSKKNIKITASDINIKPLHIALENIKKYGLENKIKLIQNDGINDISKDIDTIIISGMGGILISNILNKKNELKNIKYIIISSNNEFELVRKTLIKLGFYIDYECLLTEKEITYLIIRFKKGKKKRINYFFGTLSNKDIENINYYKNILNNNIKILKKIPKKYIIKRIKLLINNIKIKRFLLKN